MKSQICFKRALETARPQQPRSFKLRAATRRPLWRDQGAKQLARGFARQSSSTIRRKIFEQPKLLLPAAHSAGSTRR
jgi:hypothetical protein